MKMNGNKGSVSIFALLIISIILIMFSSFISHSIRVFNETLALKTVKACDDFALNSYNLYIANNYGLMGYSDRDIKLDNLIDKYLKKNMDLRLLDTLNIHVKKEKSLADPYEFNKQIQKTALLYFSFEEIENKKNKYNQIENTESESDYRLSRDKKLYINVDETSSNISELTDLNTHKTDKIYKNETEEAKKKREEAERRKEEAERKQRKKEEKLEKKFKEIKEDIDDMSSKEDQRSKKNYPSNINKISNDDSLSKINLSFDEKIKLVMYIQGTFKDGVIEDRVESSFFNREEVLNGLDYEIEYILSGSDNDNINWNDIKTKITGIRLASNSISFALDSSKRELIASLIGSSPSPHAAVVIAVGVAAWIGAETYIDIRDIVDGKAVAILKKSDQWAISLDSLMDKDNSDEEYIKISDENGAYYSDYTMFLLMTMSDDKLLKRAMDIVNMNLFLVSDGNYILEDLTVKHKIKLNMSKSKERDYIDFEMVNGY